MLFFILATHLFSAYIYIHIDFFSFIQSIYFMRYIVLDCKGFNVGENWYGPVLMPLIMEYTLQNGARPWTGAVSLSAIGGSGERARRRAVCSFGSLGLWQTIALFCV